MSLFNNKFKNICVIEKVVTSFWLSSLCTGQYTKQFVVQLNVQRVQRDKSTNQTSVDCGCVYQIFIWCINTMSVNTMTADMSTITFMCVVDKFIIICIIFIDASILNARDS